MWEDNGDGTFKAEEGDTLSELSKETGRDWKQSDYTGDPTKLQSGQVVNMGAPVETKPDGVKEITTNEEALDHYFNGNGEAVWIGDTALEAVKQSEDHLQKENGRIRSGETTLAKGNYGVHLNGGLLGKNSLTDPNGLFFIGDTPIDSEISSGTKTTVVTFTTFVRDGFWDPLPGVSNDGKGPKREMRGGTVYDFIPRTWSISFPNPSKMNWVKDEQ